MRIPKARHTHSQMDIHIAKLSQQPKAENRNLKPFSAVCTILILALMRNIFHQPKDYCHISTPPTRYHAYRRHCPDSIYPYLFCFPLFLNRLQ